MRRAEARRNAVIAAWLALACLAALVWVPVTDDGAARAEGGGTPTRPALETAEATLVSTGVVTTRRPPATPRASATSGATGTLAATGTFPPTASLTPSPTRPYTPTPTRTATPPPRAAFAGAVLINEIVTDPQSDWGGGGFASPPGAGGVTEADAYVELFITADGLSLAGWTITLDDGSPGSGGLGAGGAFGTARYVGGGSPLYTQAGDYLVLGGPAAAINNTVLVTLRDENGLLIDRVQVGAGGAPGGAATGPHDEAVSRFPNGVATIQTDYVTIGGRRVTTGA